MVFPFISAKKILSFRIVHYYQTRSKSTKIREQIKARTEVFENSFFRYYIKERLKLRDVIRMILVT